MNDRERRLREVLMDVLGIDTSQVDDASVDTIPSWDSITHLNLIMALEQDFGVRFPAAAIVELISFEHLRAAIEAGVRRP